MTRHALVALLGLPIVLLVACPAAHNVPAASFPEKTTLQLAKSSACVQGCSCRSAEHSLTDVDVAPGHKRFEFRLPKSTSAIWVEVGGRGVYYKPPSDYRPSCFYVDLKPGEHRLTVHAANPDPQIGLQTGLTVHEHNPKGPYWYRSLHFVCGGLGECTKRDLEIWAGFQRKLPRGVLDPCGSVMVRGVSFGGTRSERKAEEYQDVTVRMKVKVYEFEPYHAPKSPKCKAPIKNR